MGLIRLTRDLNIDEIINGKIKKKQAYKIFLDSTIYQPVEKLLLERNTDYHFSILIVLLTFFEPHGKFYGNKKGSENNFKLGLRKFLDYLELETNLKDELVIKLYGSLRCGLFHSMNMDGILIDSINYCGDSIFKKYENIFLINVNNLIFELKKYTEKFIDEFNEDDFNTKFDELILNKLLNEKI